MYTSTRLAISMVLCLVLAVSCKDSYTICDENKQVNYRAGFYTKSGSVDVATSPAALTLTFPGASTFIYNQQPGIASLVLGLNPVTDSVKYYIKIDNAQPADTLTLYYTNSTLTLTPECGTINVHHLTGARTTTNTLDSVKLMAAPVNNVPRENLRIYF